MYYRQGFKHLITAALPNRAVSLFPRGRLLQIESTFLDLVSCGTLRATIVQGGTGVAQATDDQERPLCTDAPVSRRPRMAESDRPRAPFSKISHNKECFQSWKDLVLNK
jgi:hypothetical protein